MVRTRISRSTLLSLASADGSSFIQLEVCALKPFYLGPPQPEEMMQFLIKSICFLM